MEDSQTAAVGRVLWTCINFVAAHFDSGLHAMKKRSPLKAKPLRVAGQSLDRQMAEFLDDHVMTPLVALLILWIIAGLEWHRYFFPRPPTPEFYTILAVGVTVYVAWRLRHMLVRYRALKLGRDGERAVAEVLDRMRESGFRVFHDVMGPGFNVDHLLVGSKGIFVIETKTVSKSHPDATIQYDGEQVSVDGFKPDRDPVRQATAIAKWVQDLVQESCGRRCHVRPVVLFPGWRVQPMKRPLPPVWILSGKELPSFIEHEPAALKPEDVKLVAFHLSRYMRSEAAEG